MLFSLSYVARNVAGTRRMRHRHKNKPMAKHLPLLSLALLHPWKAHPIATAGIVPRAQGQLHVEEHEFGAIGSPTMTAPIEQTVSESRIFVSF